MKYDFDKFEEVATQKFYEKYPSWNDVSENDLQIYDDGNIYVGNILFNVGVKLEDFEI